MAQSSDQARDGHVRGLEAKAGRPVEELVAAVLAWGPAKHNELLKRAKELNKGISVEQVAANRRKELERLKKEQAKKKK